MYLGVSVLRLPTAYICLIYAIATLMRSRDPAAEFSDMAGKALSVEWLVLKAPEIFPPLPNEQH